MAEISVRAAETTISGNDSSTRGYSSIQIDELTNGWERVSEGPSPSQATSKKRKELADHNDIAHATPLTAVLLKQRRRNKGRK
ncbi:unnamed protein product [Thelazia callipaeda]|uniref:Uncharacterized protein n=1 Tax=Thelazia callipaeda TaxID=103827 RepID=A0A0N5D9S4_THECL|nr:unnamed protein product [Thelazia callipaeda]